MAVLVNARSVSQDGYSLVVENHTTYWAVKECPGKRYGKTLKIGTLEECLRVYMKLSTQYNLKDNYKGGWRK